ncbi:two-partner secretion domain-containing protein [Nostoc sp.]|uniref:two-partner secretion domain-containing protein n=1 Tax=Nostoc sp. TaxID=1180 RepID=UPI002FF462B8
MSLRSWLSRSYHLSLSGLLILVSTIVTQRGDRTLAQVVTDPSLGTKVTPNGDGTTLEITGGTTVGDINLFHSFSNFSVESKKVVDFQNAFTINNIFVRVTGVNPSEIQGTLHAQGKANLFLINPKGIVFGEKARLNIGGSFIGTTANLVQFPGGGEFSMTSPVNPLNPLLKVNPSAFLFNQIATETINSIQLNETRLLSVPKGQSLVLLGGNVNLKNAKLQATSGRIELGGLNGEGTVGLNIDSNNFRLSFPNDVVRADVSLSETSKVTASGEGGAIQVQGKHVTLADDSSVAVNTLVGSKLGATLAVNASESVELLGASSLLTQTEGAGPAGELTIETGRLIVQDGSQISASTRSEGDGGTLSVIAKDFIQLTGTSPGFDPSALFTITDGAGSAGKLKIETRQLILQDGAQISASTRSEGQGGTLSIAATDSIKVMGTSPIGKPSGLLVGTEGPGSAGNLEIETGQLIVQDGARISASTARKSNGQGGSIIVKAGELNVLNQADITVSSEGTKQAGDLEITARSIKLDNQGKLIGQANSGDGGNIKLNLRDFLLLGHNSWISTSAGTKGAGGDGGNITINTPNGFIVAKPNENSDITANAYDGKGGKVTINTAGIFGITPRSREDLVRLLGNNDSTQIDPHELPTNDITAISQTNPTLNGQIIINVLDTDPNRGLLNLPTKLGEPQISQSCQTTTAKNQSSFVITGRGGLPANPGDILTPDGLQIDWVSLKPSNNKRSLPPVTSKATTSTPKRIIEATGATLNAFGQIVLTAHSSTATRHRSRDTADDCPKI